MLRNLKAAYAARELGISQALASHHLHQLAKYGFAGDVTHFASRTRRGAVIDGGIRDLAGLTQLEGNDE